MVESDNEKERSNNSSNSVNKNPEPEKADLLDDGSLYIPSVSIPFPPTISKIAKKTIASHIRRIERWLIKKVSRELVQKEFERWIIAQGRKAAKIYPVNIDYETMAGIDCTVISSKKGMPGENQDKILINISGGIGFPSGKNIVEAIPIAKLLNVKVIKPHYRDLAENGCPPGVNDIIKVYEEILERYDNNHVAVYGASNGGDITLQVISKLLHSKVPLPGAIACWGANTDHSKIADSGIINSYMDEAFQFHPMNRIFKKGKNIKCLKDKVDIQSLINNSGSIDLKDPLYSPIYAFLQKFPPTLLAAGTRDITLSTNALMHRALLRADIPAELIAFEAMTHMFPFHPDIPETQDLYELTADFFARKLGI